MKIIDWIKDEVDQRMYDAQLAVDRRVVEDMTKYMPMQTGAFINNVRLENVSYEGSGTVVAATPPMGRYLYYGHKMVNAATGKGPMRIPIGNGEYIFRYPRGATLVPTAYPLQYSREGVHPEWFEFAKKKHWLEWALVCVGVLIRGK